MRIEKRNYQTIMLTRKETEAFEIVNDILSKVQSDFFEDAILTSEVSGECVKVEELARARGILNFFAEPIQIFSVKGSDF